MCGSPNLQLFYEDTKRSWHYYECESCRLVFRDPKTYLPAEQEMARYSTHNNSLENSGYVKFLSPVVDWMLEVVQPGDKGLDYGSGPGPILDQLFRQHDVSVINYDPYFAPTSKALEEQYDFITCTEVFEHFYRPGEELKKLVSMIKPEGYLLVMSEWRKDREHFANWGYRTDNTHVCFLNEPSMKWIEAAFSLKAMRWDGRIILFQKHSQRH